MTDAAVQEQNIKVVLDNVRQVGHVEVGMNVAMEVSQEVVATVAAVQERRRKVVQCQMETDM